MADRAWAPADVPDWEIADVSIYEELSGQCQITELEPYDIS